MLYVYFILYFILSTISMALPIAGRYIDETCTSVEMGYAPQFQCKFQSGTVRHWTGLPNRPTFSSLRIGGRSIQSHGTALALFFTIHSPTLWWAMRPDTHTDANRIGPKVRPGEHRRTVHR